MGGRIILSFLIPLGFGSPAVADADSDALARRFLDHMEAVAPVAGTFTIETRYDPEVRASRNKSLNEWAASQGFNLAPSPDEPSLHCEWAWDGTRESLKTLDGSNIFAQFYLTPEAFVEGMAPDNYNLNGPDRPASWRPASFYLLGGSAPWSKYFSESRISTRAATDDAPPGSVYLVAESRHREIRLLIDEETGTLHGHEFDLEGEPYARLVVDRMERLTDGQAFPSLAHLTTFLKGKPYQFMTLTADRITFRPTEVAEMMPLILPSGSNVHDRVLKRVISITQPTAVESILAGQIAPESPADRPLAATLPTPAQMTVSSSSSDPARRRSGWIIGGSIAALAAVGAWFLLKGGRMWDRLRRDHP